MSLRIANNVEAMYAHTMVSGASSRLARSMERLSSGLRINRAADDAAGLGISEKMRAQISGLTMAQRNTQTGISLLQTVDGALNEVHSLLQRARELAVQYNNGTNDPGARAMITTEVVAISNEIGRIMQTMQFNGIPLLQSGLDTVTLQVGANNNETIGFSLATLMAPINSIVQDNTFFFTLGDPADIPGFDRHLEDLNKARARFGAIQNRLEHSLASTAAYQENLMAAEARLRDVDMAQEMTSFTKHQIVMQSSTAMLAHANQSSSVVLNLLKTSI